MEPPSPSDYDIDREIKRLINTIRELTRKQSGLEEHEIRISKLERDIHSEWSRLRADYLILLHDLRNCPPSFSSQEANIKSSNELKAVADGLQRIKDEMPRPPKWALALSLGTSAPSLFRIVSRERILYKQEYEAFKFRMTTVALLLSLVNFVVVDSIWLDKCIQFLSLYFYATTTLREHILWVNGSRIKVWWMWHHYLSIALTGILLIWQPLPPGGTSSYNLFRGQFLVFSIYLGLVQMLQFQYQTARLYTLRALSKASQLDVSTETTFLASTNLFASLLFLFPFLLLGQVFQIYNAYCLYLILEKRGFYTEAGSQSSFFYEWHAAAIALIFLILGVGNIVMTFVAYFGKFRNRMKENEDE